MTVIYSGNRKDFIQKMNMDIREKYENLGKIEDMFSNQTFKAEKNYIFKSGTGNILVTAPHSVEYFRDGELKYSETKTGLLSLILNDECDVPTFIRTRNDNDDPEFDEKSDMRDGIIKYIINSKNTENEIKLLLDLHSSKADKNFDICLGVNSGINILNNYDLLDKVKRSFKYKYSVVVDELFTTSFYNKVSTSVIRECKIPAILVKINISIISDYEKLVNFKDVFKKMIDEIKDYK